MTTIPMIYCALPHNWLEVVGMVRKVHPNDFMIDYMGGNDREKSRATPRSYPEQLKGWSCHQLRWGKLGKEQL